MRRAFFILLALGSFGCEDHRTFDERYAQTGNEVEQRAAKLDAQANSFNANEPAMANTQQGTAR